ncbi:hypothetical protein U6G28_08685 [Actinomycetaceae bacterium MB13-C1-2]|nr:hypothetical protein U6G28_08685 [Actinomycetaceae bacterium MB13-C1-2]
MKLRLASILASATLAVFALTGCGAGGTDSDSGGWPKEIETNFLDACDGSSEGESEYCKCSLEQLQKKYTADEFAQLEQQLDSDPAALDEILGAIEPCFELVGSD